MDAIDLLNSNEAELPRLLGNGDFQALVDGMFNGYIGLFANLYTGDYVTQQLKAAQPSVTALCDRIRNAIHEYLRGFPHLAFDHLQAGITAIQPHFDLLCTPQNVAQTQALSELYRIRTAGPEGWNFQRPDLHHIPFQCRHLVTRQRYSLPGLPCLYLGGTLYIAWEEIGRPSFDSIYYARFRPQATATITYLDFGYRPAVIAAMVSANQQAHQSQSALADHTVARAVCWPLLAACSLRRRFGSSPFIHEYVVPQLLLQYITHRTNHDGIRYFSVNIDAYVRNPVMLCNYVFPAKVIAPTGQCQQLRSKFEMSPPLSWQLMERSAMPHGMATGMPLHGSSEINLVAAFPHFYYQTPFGQIESSTIMFPCASF